MLFRQQQLHAGTAIEMVTRLNASTVIRGDLMNDGKSETAAAAS